MVLHSPVAGGRWPPAPRSGRSSSTLPGRSAGWVVPSWTALPGHGPSAAAGQADRCPDSLLVSAEQFITLFHSGESPGAARPADLAGSPRDRGVGHVLAHSGRAGLWRACRLAEQLAMHRAAVLAEPAGAGPPRGHRGTGHRRRVGDAPARGDQRRPDPADDHRVRAGRAGPARAADPQLPAGPVRGLRDRRRRRHRGPGQRRAHPAGPRSRLAGRPAGRPVRHTSAARAGGRARRSPCTRYPPTQYSR